MKKSKVMMMAFCASISLLAGCARQISPDVYSDSHVGEASRSVRGVIINAREVQVAGKDKIDHNAAGIIGGGAAGALLGNQIGGGTGRLAASVAGGVAGAVAGALIQGELEKQVGIEYTVEMANRELVTIVQGPQPRYQPGQRVIVMISNNGRSRIAPDNTMAGPNYYGPVERPSNAYNGYGGY